MSNQETIKSLPLLAEANTTLTIKKSVTKLTEKIGITMANVSVFKNGEDGAIRLSTLEAICQTPDCQPGDILEYKK